MKTAATRTRLRRETLQVRARLARRRKLMPKPVAKKAKAGRPRLPRPHGEVCSVPGCGRPLNVGYGGTRKYCPLHYQRHRKGKSMNPEPERARDLGDLVLLSVRVSKVLGDRMKKLASHTGRSMSALAREALEYWAALPDRILLLKKALEHKGDAEPSISPAKQKVISVDIPAALNLATHEAELESQSLADLPPGARTLAATAAADSSSSEAPEVMRLASDPLRADWRLIDVIDIIYTVYQEEEPMNPEHFAGKNSPLTRAAGRVAEDHACSKSSEPEVACLGCARVEQARRCFELEVDVLAAELGRMLRGESFYEALRGLVTVSRVAPRHLVEGVGRFLAELDAAAESETRAEQLEDLEPGHQRKTLDLGWPFYLPEDPEPLLYAQPWAVCPCCEGAVRWASQEISEDTTGTCLECSAVVGLSLEEGFVTIERPMACPSCEVRALKKDKPGSSWFRGSAGVCTACGERVVMGRRCLQLVRDRA